METRSCGSFKGVRVQVAGRRLQHLEEVGGETRSCGSFQGLKFRWQDLLQNLEEVGMATRFCGSCKKIMVQVAGLVTVPGGS